jgi:ribosome-binding factor A
MSIRAERVAGEIQKVLSEPVAELARENKAGIATVTSVRMSPDLQIAYVYVSVYGGKISPQAFMNIIETVKPELRQLVGSKVRLRLTPELRFFYDDTFDKIERIEQLLKEAKDSNKSVDENNKSVDEQ